jgi:formiminoglutamase
MLEKSDNVYLSLCLDVFAAAIAPGVSAPQALGLTPWQIIPALRQLAVSNKVISLDVVELAPNFDLDQRTAKLAALLICDFLTARFTHKE